MRSEGFGSIDWSWMENLPWYVSFTIQARPVTWPHLNAILTRMQIEQPLVMYPNAGKHKKEI